MQISGNYLYLIFYCSLTERT